MDKQQEESLKKQLATAIHDFQAKNHDFLLKLAGITPQVALFSPRAVPTCCDEFVSEEVNKILFVYPDTEGILEYWAHF